MDDWSTWCDYYAASQAAADRFLDAWVVMGMQALNQLPPSVRAAVRAIAAQDPTTAFRYAVKHADCRGVDLFARTSQLQGTRRSAASGKLKTLSLTIPSSSLTNAEAGATGSDCDAIIEAIAALERGEWPGDVLPDSVQSTLEDIFRTRAPEWMVEAWEQRNQETMADLLAELRVMLEENCGSTGGAVFDPSGLEAGHDPVVPGTFPSSSSSSSTSNSTTNDTASSGWDYLVKGVGLVSAYGILRKVVPWLP